MTKIEKAIYLANIFYNEDEFNHAMRVAGYSMAAASESFIDGNDAFVVGLLHDIIEETHCTESVLIEYIGTKLASSIHILTKDDEAEYMDYIHDIIESNDELAILVKRADMKDHFSQLDTLTDKLRDKYLPAIQYFL